MDTEQGSEPSVSSNSASLGGWSNIEARVRWDEAEVAAAGSTGNMPGGRKTEFRPTNGEEFNASVPG